MEKDIFGRELKVGSLVVVKATGRDSSGLKGGVIIDEHGLVLIYGPEKRKTSSNNPLRYSEYFLIENPSEMEKELAKEIMLTYENKKALVPLKMSDMQHLHTYKNKIEDTFIFLKHFSFDLRLAFDDSLLESISFDNHFIKWNESWMYLDNFCFKKNSIPTLYSEDTLIVTEQNIIDTLMLKTDYHDKTKKERRVFDIEEIIKLSSGKIIDPEILFTERKQLIKAESPYLHKKIWSLRNWGNSCKYEASLYVDNIKISK